jgi:hypothetical protein
MRNFAVIVTVLGISVLSGCAAKTRNASTLPRSIDRTVLVPLPERTPYDGIPEARQVYLRSYANGYQTGVAGCLGTCCIFDDVPFRDAEIQGSYEGEAAGMKIWDNRNLIENTQSIAESGRRED